jgi:hypothetical protein
LASIRDLMLSTAHTVSAALLKSTAHRGRPPTVPRLRPERRGPGERDRHPKNLLPDPEADQRGADRAAVAAALEPAAQAVGGGEQRGRAGGRAQGVLGKLDFALLVEVGEDQPLVLIEGMAGGIDDGAAVDDAEAGVRSEISNIGLLPAAPAARRPDRRTT